MSATNSHFLGGSPHLLCCEGAQRAKRGLQHLGLVRERALVVPQQVRCALHLLRRASLQETLERWAPTATWLEALRTWWGSTLPNMWLAWQSPGHTTVPHGRAFTACTDRQCIAAQIQQCMKVATHSLQDGGAAFNQRVAGVCRLSGGAHRCSQWPHFPRHAAGAAACKRVHSHHHSDV